MLPSLCYISTRRERKKEVYRQKLEIRDTFFWKDTEIWLVEVGDRNLFLLQGCVIPSVYNHFKQTDVFQATQHVTHVKACTVNSTDWRTLFLSRKSSLRIIMEGTKSAPMHFRRGTGNKQLLMWEHWGMLTWEIITIMKSMHCDLCQC